MTGRHLRHGLIAIATGVLAALLVIGLAGPLTPLVDVAFGHVTTLRVCAAVGVLALVSAAAAIRHRRPRSPPRRRARDVVAQASSLFAQVPDPVVIAAIAGLATGVWIAVGRLATLPGVFGDELIYSGLGKSVVHGEGLEVLGTPERGYGVVYPILLAPLYGLAGNGVHAFDLVKGLNAAIMSMTCIPTYSIARRVVPRGWAFGTSALAVAVPSMANTRFVMTEAVFYPAFVVATLLMIRALEHPTARRQAISLLAIVLLTGIRAQGVVLLLAYVLAMCTLGISRHALGDTLRRSRPAWTGMALLAVVGLATTRGHPSHLLGAYAVLVRPYDVIALLEWHVWSTAALAFSVAIVPALLFPVALARMLRRTAPPVEQACAAACGGVVLSTVVATAVLSASPYGLDRLHERNLFYVTPLLLVCTAYVVVTGLPGPGPLTASCTALLVALAVSVPSRLALSDTVADLPTGRLWRNLQGDLPGVPVPVVLGATVALTATWLLLTRSPVVTVAAVVIVFYAVIAEETAQRSPLTRSATASLGWVDDALPRKARATILFTPLPPAGCGELGQGGSQEELALWTEFFNVKVNRVVHLFGDNGMREVASMPVTMRRDGVLTTGRGARALKPAYVVTDDRVHIDGKPVLRLNPRLLWLSGTEDRTEKLELWKTDLPLRISRPAALRAEGRRVRACPS